MSESISHAEMIAAVKRVLDVMDHHTVFEDAVSPLRREGLRAVLAHLERTQPADTQADLTGRARVPVEKWFGRPGGYDHPMLPDVAAALQSEREAAAANAREIIRDLVENFGVGGPKSNKAFAVATRFLLASPPAPQEETR